MDNLGFYDHEISAMAEVGLTPESARDLVVDKLRKANLSEENIKHLLKPIDKLNKGDTEEIMCMSVYYPNQPDDWIKYTGKDFSDFINYTHCLMFMNY